MCRFFAADYRRKCPEQWLQQNIDDLSKGNYWYSQEKAKKATNEGENVSGREVFAANNRKIFAGFEDDPDVLYWPPPL